VALFVMALLAPIITMVATYWIAETTPGHLSYAIAFISDTFNDQPGPRPLSSSSII